jgi:hypothetical protein
MSRITYSVIAAIVVLAGVLGIIASQSCIFDSCALINGLLLGAVASLLATIISTLMVKLHEEQSLKKKYGKAEGYYRGKRFERYEEDEGEYKKGEFRWVLEKEFVSEAKIEYKRNNIPSITLQELKGNRLKWTGHITMELETHGSLVWEYVDLPSAQYRFGFKRLIISQKTDQFYVYLIGEESEGYGKEVLIRTEREQLETVF